MHNNKLSEEAVAVFAEQLYFVYKLAVSSNVLKRSVKVVGVKEAFISFKPKCI